MSTIHPHGDWTVRICCSKRTSWLFCGMIWPTGFWFRVFGYGVRVMKEDSRQTSFAPGTVFAGVNFYLLNPGQLRCLTPKPLPKRFP